MNIDLTEMKTIEASITDVAEIQHTSGCNLCSGQLKEHSTTSMLLYCDKCKKYSLKQNLNEKKTTSIVLNHGKNDSFSSNNMSDRMFI
jgi:hypothetical protein